MTNEQDHPDVDPSNDDLDLASAFRSVRDRYDGTHDESNATLQRALFRTRKRERKQKVVRWFVLPAAAALLASTAWAGVTGRLPTVRSMLDAVYASPSSREEHSERSPASPVAPIASAVTPAPTSAPLAVNEPAPEPPVEEPAPAPSVVVVTPPPRPVAVRAIEPKPAPLPVASQPAPATDVRDPAPPPAVVAPAPSASDPHAALFAEAHRIHFNDKDPARALAAWDRYLAVAPSGRFAPEARYNRAIALVRLGRRAEAQQELAVFANGMYGDYRRAEAKALLDALTHDAR